MWGTHLLRCEEVEMATFAVWFLVGTDGALFLSREVGEACLLCGDGALSSFS